LTVTSGSRELLLALWMGLVADRFAAFRNRRGRPI
jgi:hypothetical protein